MSQLKTIEEVYQNDKKNLDFFTDSYKNNFSFEIGINQETFPKNSGERKFSPMDRSLRRELKSVFVIIIIGLILLNLKMQLKLR